MKTLFILLFLGCSISLQAQFYIWPTASGGGGSGTVTNSITNVTSSLFTITLSGSGGSTNADVGLTTDTPQFGRLGLGGAADGFASLLTTNSIRGPLGSSSNPTYGFTSSTNTGFWMSTGGNAINFTVDGIHTVRQEGTSAFRLNGNIPFGWSPTTPNGGSDLLLYRDSAATLQLGSDAASVVTPQSFKAADGLGTDKAGADFQIEGGQSTGTGRAGAVILRTGETLTTSSSANAYITRFYLSAKPVDLTNATAVLVFNVSLASGKTCGLHVFATTRVDDGTDFQGATDDFTCVAVNKAGTVSVGSLSTSLGSTVATSGTISTVWTAVANGNGVDVKLNETTTVITPTTRRVRWRVEVDSNDTALSVTPQ